MFVLQPMLGGVTGILELLMFGKWEVEMVPEFEFEYALTRGAKLN